MNKLIISQQARSDIREIVKYIAGDNHNASIDFERRLQSRFMRIFEQPSLGEPCFDLRLGMRRVAEGNYVIYYISDSSGTRVLRVIHGARDAEKMKF